MSAEQYDYSLRLLKLPRNACEQDIRSAVTKEMRVWTYRQNSADLDLRQEAERKIKALEIAEQVLLGPEGQMIRRGLGSEPVAEAQLEMPVDSETVARNIEHITSVRGTRTQERKGTVLCRRATIFFQGIDYIFDELVHKKYEAAQDRKRCTASQGGLVLFEWFCETGLNRGQGKTGTYIRGPWVVDLVAFADECDSFL